MSEHINILRVCWLHLKHRIHQYRRLNLEIAVFERTHNDGRDTRLLLATLASTDRGQQKLEQNKNPTGQDWKDTLL